MTEPRMPHSQFAEALGAYVLGALDDRERAQVDAHLRGCERCSRELAELERAAEILPRSVPQLRPPEPLRDRIMRSVEAEAAAQSGGRDARPRPAGIRRFALPRPALGAAAATVIGVAVAAIIVLGGRQGTPGGGRVLSARITDPAVAARARVSVRVAGEHATLRVRALPHPPPRRVYQVWLQGPGRSPVPAGSTFMLRYGTVDVRRPVHRGERLLVTIEPAGGSPRPTRPPLIVARPA